MNLHTIQKNPDILRSGFRDSKFVRIYPMDNITRQRELDNCMSLFKDVSLFSNPRNTGGVYQCSPNADDFSIKCLPADMN